jgi:hypothetical protein
VEKMKINLPSIKNIMPSLRGLNLWTLTQKVKDHTVQRTSTIQLLQRIDIYRLSDSDRAKLIEITDPKEQQAFIKAHGKLNRSTGEMKSHSFTLQFSQIFIEYPSARVWGNSASTGLNINNICINGVVRDTSNGLYALWSTLTTTASTYGNGFVPALNAPTTNTSYGILVGTGTTAPATLDYKMQTLTAHGSGANQMLYGATSVGGAGVNGANVDTVISRIVVNGSGGSITLKEVGMAICITTNGSLNTQTYFLIAHDAVNQAVANGEIALVSYDIRTTV